MLRLSRRTTIWIPGVRFQASPLLYLHYRITGLVSLGYLLIHANIRCRRRYPCKQLVSDDAFAYMNNLTRIQLDLCNLTRLPAALKSCPQVQSVNLLNNPDIVCTCLEASPLLPLYSKQNPVDMYGYCNGNLGINTFMKTLAKDCLPPTTKTLSWILTKTKELTISHIC